MHPIILAPTTLMTSPALEFIDAAIEAGYDGIGIRLYPSPGLPFFPVVGDRDLMREVKQRIDDSGLQVCDVLTCYLQPEMDFEAMRVAHEFGAELGARYALAIGDDPEWDRMVQHFGRLCEQTTEVGLTCALEAPVSSRALNTLALNLRLIDEAAPERAVLAIDPVHFHRSGATAEELRGLDPRLIEYTQLRDTTSLTPGDPDCLPGEGTVPLHDILDVMPADLPLSVEYTHRDESMSASEWARHVIEGTRRFLDGYEARQETPRSG
jgi:sugar phosphate isomerase/epimerase